MNTPSPTHNQPEYTVSEVSSKLKRVVEDNFGHVRVRGEISGLSRPKSGHMYLALKDENAVMDGVCWKGVASRFTFQPEDGLEVICTGRISTYPGRSKYQIIIENMEPAGAGALMALLEKRKAALQAEGLFDPAHKKALPFMPRTIGVVTSPTGAVIRDILHRIADRFPCHVLVWPVMVQGEGAAEQIASAINGFNALPKGGNIPQPDLLIVARGGGSLEDLWCFNEEVVVRAAAASRIPLISAVGHETDTTLIDYASDRRAPTPTAAAEMAVPVREEWLLTVREHGMRMDRSVLRYLEDRRAKVEGLARGLPRPVTLMEHATQRLDDWSERLAASLPQLISRKQDRLTQAGAGLRLPHLQREIARYQESLGDYQRRMNGAYLQKLTRREERLSHLMQLLDSYHYKKVLARGYAIVRSVEGELVASSADASQAGALELEFHDGKVAALVAGDSALKPKSKPDKAKEKSKDTTLQDSLF